jgi:hypothetical protein
MVWGGGEVPRELLESNSPNFLFGRGDEEVLVEVLKDFLVWTGLNSAVEVAWMAFISFRAFSGFSTRIGSWTEYSPVPESTNFGGGGGVDPTPVDRPKVGLLICFPI